MLWVNFRYFCNFNGLECILVVSKVLGLFNNFSSNLVILVFYGHFGLFFFTFQCCFNYLGDFRGILVILQVLGDFFFFFFLVILEVLWLFCSFWWFYVFWSIYRYFDDFRGILIKKISLGCILVVLEVLILFWWF